MAKFKVLYFRQDEIEQAEEIEARDILEAIQIASAKLPNLRAEVWSENECVVEIGSSPGA